MGKIEAIDLFINMTLDAQKQIYNKLPKASQNQVDSHICFKLD